MKKNFRLASQQIIGEWGTLKNFAEMEGINFSSLRMVINMRGGRSRAVEEALEKYNYHILLQFEHRLNDLGMTWEDYVKKSKYNRIDIIDTLRKKITRPKILAEMNRLDIIRSPRNGRSEPYNRFYIMGYEKSIVK